MLNSSVPEGTYIVAVSGGVDSVSLLYALASTYSPKTHKFIVAHFDHGIRDDSHIDRSLVKELAKNHGVTFVYSEGRLGKHASEDTARTARYAFLYDAKRAANARAIITAHHHDDKRETIVHNLLRGTGRQGVRSLQSSDEVLRPLLHVSKPKLYAYAKAHSLKWNEDESNKETRYKRNYIRHKLLPRLSPAQERQLSTHIENIQTANYEIDALIINLLHTQKSKSSLDRELIISLPHAVAKELLVHWLRQNNIRSFQKQNIERLIVAIKTAKNGSRHDIVAGHQLKLTEDLAVLVATNQ